MTARPATARSVARRAVQERTTRGKRPPRRTAGLVAGGVLAALVVVTGAVAGTVAARRSPAAAPSASSDASPVPAPTPSTAAGRWQAATLAHFTAMNSVLLTLVSTAQQWAAHKVPDAQVHQLLVKELPAVEQTRSELAAATPYAPAPHALADYRSAVDLYLASFQVLDAATRTPDSALQQQLSLAQRRLRLLGDRVFDQASAALQALDGPARQVEGTVVQRQAEVPDWRSLGLAAGPPLHATNPATAPLRAYQEHRPTTSLGAWRARVAQLRLPSGDSEGAVLRAGSTGQLDALSSQLEAASERLYAAPDPLGLRLESTRTQLSLLVHAEALRTVEGARLAPPVARAALLAAARGEVAVADSLWSGLLAARTTPVTALA